jgi:hypothetical protein
MLMLIHADPSWSMHDDGGWWMRCVDPDAIFINKYICRHDGVMEIYLVCRSPKIQSEYTSMGESYKLRGVQRLSRSKFTLKN